MDTQVGCPSKTAMNEGDILNQLNSNLDQHCIVSILADHSFSQIGIFILIIVVCYICFGNYHASCANVNG